MLKKKNTLPIGSSEFQNKTKIMLYVPKLPNLVLIGPLVYET